MHILLFVGLLLIGAGFLLEISRQISRNAKSTTYTRYQSLFTPAEGKLLSALNEGLGQFYQIHGKVRIADVIHVDKELNENRRMEAMEAIKSRHFDFLLCDKKDATILCAIEIHNKKYEDAARRKRDSMVKSVCESARLPLVTIPARPKYDIGEIRTRVLKAIGACPSTELPRMASQISDKNKTVTRAAPVRQESVRPIKQATPFIAELAKAIRPEPAVDTAAAAIAVKPTASQPRQAKPVITRPAAESRPAVRVSHQPVTPAVTEPAPQSLQATTETMPEHEDRFEIVGEEEAATAVQHCPVCSSQMEKRMGRKGLMAGRPFWYCNTQACGTALPMTQGPAPELRRLTEEEKRRRRVA